MEYSEVVNTAFATGPAWSQKYANFAEKFVLSWLFLAYFGACVADNLLIASNYGQVIGYYMDDTLCGNVSIAAKAHEVLNANTASAVTNVSIAANAHEVLDANTASAATNVSLVANAYEVFNANTASVTNVSLVANVTVDFFNKRWVYPCLRAIMACVLIPLVLLIWVPDLKYLAPVSMVANCMMVTVLAITFYYLVQQLKSLSELDLFGSMKQAPQFFSITLFAMENIGVMMPLENNMKNPRNFLGTCGILNKGMFMITFVYLLLGALGYMKYGNQVNTIITTNLPVTDIPAQIVKILIGSTVLFSFSLQFYVCREMVWSRVRKYFPNRPILAEYSIRALLVIACVSIAIALPMIGPLVTLVGAFGFSLLGIICPVVIELMVYSHPNLGYGRWNWRVFKNAFLIMFGLCMLIFGTQFALNEIITELFPK